MSIAAAQRLFAKAFRLPIDRVREVVVDTGGPHLFSVYVESGIPDRYTYPQVAPIWARLELSLTAAYGFPVYFESINAGESRLYKVIPIANVLPIP